MISQTFSEAVNTTASLLDLEKLECSNLGAVRSTNDGTVRRIKGVNLATRSSDARQPARTAAASSAAFALTVEPHVSRYHRLRGWEDSGAVAARKWRHRLYDGEPKPVYAKHDIHEERMAGIVSFECALYSSGSVKNWLNPANGGRLGGARKGLSDARAVNGGCHSTAAFRAITPVGAPELTEIIIAIPTTPAKTRLTASHAIQGRKPL